jgi:hypothetical protein
MSICFARKPNPLAIAKTVVQVAMLVGLGIVVAAVLWIHDSRASSRYFAENAEVAQELLTDMGPVIDRQDIRRWYGEDFPKTPFVNSAEHLKRALPPGAMHEILLKGSVLARLPKRENGPATCIAYVFEMRFFRIIESNDGQRVVEVRFIDRIRRAKIVTLQQGLAIDLGRPADPILGGIRFPTEEFGMTVAPVEEVARAILADGAEEVIAESSSRAFIEEDYLSGRWVRLTFVDGTGVEAVEPIDWQLSYDETAFLFAQPLMAAKMFLPNRNRRQPRVVEINQLAGFFEPGLGLGAADELFLVRHAGDRTTPLREYEMLRSANVFDGRAGDAVPGRCFGKLRYNPKTRLLESAELLWPMNEVIRMRNKLLFEYGFQPSPELHLSYHCRVQ